MATTLRCINASGQPRLILDGYYELVLDVQKAYRPGRDEAQSGYVVKPEGDSIAIPYVYNRNRFTVVTD